MYCCSGGLYGVQNDATIQGSHVNQFAYQYDYDEYVPARTRSGWNCVKRHATIPPQS